MNAKTALQWLLANSFKDGDIVKIPADLFYQTVKNGLSDGLITCVSCGNAYNPEDMRDGKLYKKVCIKCYEMGF